MDAKVYVSGGSCTYRMDGLTFDGDIVGISNTSNVCPTLDGKWMLNTL